ncbi:MAG: ornithine cyclodeaminase [Rhodobacteraceae bacterium]|nr:ornithine cyclodeaminase [Paracoccaceae bacterium]MCP5341302.1 ornithine cyclodeaminase [Paracoccaceae bacterium]
MSIEIIGPEAEAHLDWIALSDTLAEGHLLPRAEVGDTLLGRGRDTLLTRSAWIDGMGLAVKAATIYPDNHKRGAPNVNGVVALFSDQDGMPEAYIDFALLTKWKTAADSLLAARRLARPGPHEILIVGAGTVALSMFEAYSAAFTGAHFTVWTRNPQSARRFADKTGATVAGDLESAVRNAKIIATATMAHEPLIKGAWLQPGTHLDLIGAFTPDMREADSDCFARARVFVDARATTMNHIGELMVPLAEGAITKTDIVADFYDIAAGDFTRRSDDEITISKNGGGAHLDLMTARYILGAWRSR